MDVHTSGGHLVVGGWWWILIVCETYLEYLHLSILGHHTHVQSQILLVYRIETYIPYQGVWMKQKTIKNKKPTTHLFLL